MPHLKGGGGPAILINGDFRKYKKKALKKKREWKNPFQGSALKRAAGLLTQKRGEQASESMGKKGNTYSAGRCEKTQTNKVVRGPPGSRAMR